MALDKNIFKLNNKSSLISTGAGSVVPPNQETTKSARQKEIDASVGIGKQRTNGDTKVIGHKVESKKVIGLRGQEVLSNTSPPRSASDFLKSTNDTRLGKAAGYINDTTGVVYNNAVPVGQTSQPASPVQPQTQTQPSSVSSSSFSNPVSNSTVSTRQNPTVALPTTPPVLAVGASAATSRVAPISNIQPEIPSVTSVTQIVAKPTETSVAKLPTSNEKGKTLEQSNQSSNSASSANDAQDPASSPKTANQETTKIIEDINSSELQKTQDPQGETIAVGGSEKDKAVAVGHQNTEEVIAVGHQKTDTDHQGTKQDQTGNIEHKFQAQTAGPVSTGTTAEVLAVGAGLATIPSSSFGTRNASNGNANYYNGAAAVGSSGQGILSSTGGKIEAYDSGNFVARGSQGVFGSLSNGGTAQTFVAGSVGIGGDQSVLLVAGENIPDPDEYNIERFQNPLAGTEGNIIPLNQNGNTLPGGFSVRTKPNQFTSADDLVARQNIDNSNKINREKINTLGGARGDNVGSDLGSDEQPKDSSDINNNTDSSENQIVDNNNLPDRDLVQQVNADRINPNDFNQENYNEYVENADSQQLNNLVQDGSTNGEPKPYNSPLKDKWNKEDERKLKTDIYLQKKSISRQKIRNNNGAQNRAASTNSIQERANRFFGGKMKGKVAGKLKQQVAKGTLTFLAGIFLNPITWMIIGSLLLGLIFIGGIIAAECRPEGQLKDFRDSFVEPAMWAGQISLNPLNVGQTTAVVAGVTANTIGNIGNFLTGKAMEGVLPPSDVRKAIEALPGCSDLSKNCDTGGGAGAISGALGTANGKVTAAECTELIKYKPFIEEASRDYGVPVPIIAGLMSRETNVGLLFKGTDKCAGMGDSDNGHGLVQIDGSSGAWGGSSRGPRAINTPTVVKDKDGKPFIWNDCRSNIRYGAFHLLEIEKFYGADALKKGPKGSYEWWRAILNGNNGGGNGVKNESVTAGGNYGKDTMDRAADAAKCLGITNTTTAYFNTRQQDLANKYWSEAFGFPVLAKVGEQIKRPVLTGLQVLDQRILAFNKVMAGTVSVEAAVGKAVGTTTIDPSMVAQLKSLEDSKKIVWTQTRAGDALPPSQEASTGRLNIATVKLLIEMANTVDSITITGLNDGGHSSDSNHYKGLSIDIAAITAGGKQYVWPSGGGNTGTYDGGAGTKAAADFGVAINKTGLVKKILTWEPLTALLKAQGVNAISVDNHRNHYHIDVNQDGESSGTSAIGGDGCPCSDGSSGRSESASEKSNADPVDLKDVELPNSYTVMDETGKVLFAKDDNNAINPASAIKVIIGALVIKDKIDVNKEITITKDMMYSSDENQYVVGNKYKISNLVTKMLTNSNNTAANALIEELGGISSVDTKAKTNGLNSVNFKALFNGTPGAVSGRFASTKDLTSAMKIIFTETGDLASSVQDAIKGNLSKFSYSGDIAHKHGNTKTAFANVAYVEFNGKKYFITVFYNKDANLYIAKQDTFVEFKKNTIIDKFFEGIKTKLSSPTTTATNVSSKSTFLNVFEHFGTIKTQAASSRPNSYSDLTEEHKTWMAKIAEKRGYFKTSVINASELTSVGNNQRMEKAAAEAFKKMQTKASSENVTLSAVSGFRDLNDQVKTFFTPSGVTKPIPTSAIFENGKGDESAYNGRLDASAVPGYSEHHTGKVVDINSVSVSFENTPSYKWLDKNAKTFGFELSYPKNSSSGANYEPWHWRFGSAQGGSTTSGSKSTAGQSSDCKCPQAGNSSGSATSANISKQFLASKTGQDKWESNNPKYAIIHYTAYGAKIEGKESARRFKSFVEGGPGNSGDKGWAHYLIDVDGTSFSIVDENKTVSGTKDTQSAIYENGKKLTSSVDKNSIQYEIHYDPELSQKISDAQIKAVAGLVVKSGLKPENIMTHWGVQPSTRRDSSDWIKPTGEVTPELINFVKYAGWATDDTKATEVAKLILKNNIENAIKVWEDSSVGKGGSEVPLSTLKTGLTKVSSLNSIFDLFSTVKASAAGKLNKLTGTDAGSQFLNAVAEFEGAFADKAPNTPQTNKNPGNIKGTGDTFVEKYIKQKYPTAKLSLDDKKHIVFETEEQGWDGFKEYMKQNFSGSKDAYKSVKTVGEFFQIYAPSSDGNNLNEYMKFIEDKKIKLSDGKLITKDTKTSEIATILGGVSSGLTATKDCPTTDSSSGNISTNADAAKLGVKVSSIPGTISKGGPFTPAVRAFLDTIASGESGDPKLITAYGSGNFSSQGTTDFDANESKDLHPELKTKGYVPDKNGFCADSTKVKRTCFPCPNDSKKTCQSALNIGRYQYYGDHVTVDTKPLTKSPLGYFNSSPAEYSGDVKKANEGLAKAKIDFVIKDFQPISQDFYPLGKYANVAAGLGKEADLSKVLGDGTEVGLKAAIEVAKKEWASVPGAGFGQREVPYAQYLSTYKTRLAVYQADK